MLQFRRVDQQGFAAPKGSVVAQTRAIQGQADGRADVAVFGQDGVDVRKVVLQGQAGQPGLAGKARAQRRG